MGCCSSESVVSAKNNPKAPLIEKTRSNENTLDNSNRNYSNRKHLIGNEKYRNHSYPKSKKINDNSFDYDNNYIPLKVSADSKEKMYPIWVEKGSYLKFRVFGKWRIDSQYPYTDSTGIPTSLVQGFNNGSLVGRIGSSDYFGIKDPTVKYASISGPLYLKMNLPKLKLSPSGMLIVKVYDAKKMDNNDINKKRGWLETSDENTNFSLGHLEYELVTNINNMKVNPMLFFEKNVGNYTDMILTQDYMKNLDKASHKNPLEIGNFISQEMENFFRVIKTKRLDKYYSKTSLTAYVEKITKKLTLFLGSSLSSDFKLFYKTTRELDVMRMSLEFLYDCKNRDYIFTNKYKRIAAKIEKKCFNDMNLVVIVLYNDEDKKKK